MEWEEKIDIKRNLLNKMKNIMLNKCKNCNVEIAEDRRFCSLSCSSSYNNKIRRALIREKYINNPNKCVFCGKNIMPRKEESITETKRKKFCNRSCAAKYNNKARAKNKPAKLCLYCGNPVPDRSKDYCSSEHLHLYKYKIYIEKWKQGKESGTTNNGDIVLTVRRYILKKYNNKCHKCGWNEVNPITNKIPVQINHIDGNYRNNREENLELLCPNCHSLTPNYRALNNGQGRGSR